MTVGILGLGLIGGSLARAYKLAGHTVYAKNRDESMLSFAMLSGAVDGKLDRQTIPTCDLILLLAGSQCAPDFQGSTGHRLLRHQAGSMQPLLPSGGRIRLHLCGRASHGRLPVLRL